MKTIRLSSNWTLILKVFIPITWFTFFLSFLLSSWIANPIEVPQITSFNFRIGLIVFILGGILFFWFTFFRLKRVDANAEFIFVSNYFKTYRYTIESIESFVIYDHLLFKGIHILLKEKGKNDRTILTRKSKHN